jgi:hypothetical protein
MSFAECYFDLVFAIDHSGSIRDTNIRGTPDNWDIIIQALRTTVQSFNIESGGTNVAAVSFGE